ncbi:MAG: septal ring lytic transglycosylase RlpA family protein [Granulosicoccaceae bacterium]
MTLKNTLQNTVLPPVQKLGCLSIVCFVLSACGAPSGGSSDGPGTFYALGNSRGLDVQDLPRSRSGNASVYTVFGKQYSVLDSAEGFTEQGIASWYGSKFHGRDTASGEKYNMYAMTAAHKNLPLPVYVQVTNLDNGRELVVKVNDRGPFIEGRIIDLSFAAARELGIYDSGTANVEIKALSEAVRDGGEKVNLATPVVIPATPEAIAAPVAVTDAPEKRYGWVVQLGAFKEAANASTLLEKLSPNLAARSSINHDANSQLYRVLVGPMASSAEASQLVDTLASSGIDGYSLKARFK